MKFQKNYWEKYMSSVVHLTPNISMKIAIFEKNDNLDEI